MTTDFDTSHSFASTVFKLGDPFSSETFKDGVEFKKILVKRAFLSYKS